MPKLDRFDILRRLALCLLPLGAGFGATLVLLLLASGPARTAYAGTLTYPGCGASIQACIDAASPGDAILISAGDYTESLTLGKAVSLTGELSSTTVLHALPNTRVLTVTGAAVDASVVISGLTFTGGLVSGTLACPDSCGGGLQITGGAEPSLTDVIFANNSAGYEGGGLYATSAISLTNVAFLTNTSYFQGGGFYIDGDVTLSDSYFQGNQCQWDCWGGGAYVGRRLLLTATVFNGNAAAFEGGGLFAALNLNMTDSLFLSNTAGEGGGAFVAWGPATVNGGVFERNSNQGLYAGYSLALTGTQFISNSGGTGPGGGAFSAGPTTILDALFQENSAVDGGGLAAYDDYDPLALTDSQFISNTAQNTGGGAVIHGDATIINGLFQANQCTGNDCSGGGLFECTGNSCIIGGGGDKSLVITGTRFLTNSAAGAGGGAQATGFVAATNSLFQGNKANEGGGLATSADQALTGTQFLNNHASSLAGGDFDYGALTILTDDLFQDNSCSPYYLCSGGGLQAATLRASGTQFISNTSTYQGGGAWARDAALTDGSFVSDTAQYGGGVFADNVVLTDTQLLSNMASVNGGGLLAAGGGSLTGAVVASNTAGLYGGGIYASGNLAMMGAQILSNTAEVGGGAYVYGGQVTLLNGLFQNNRTANVPGSGVAGDGGGLAVTPGSPGPGILVLTGTEFLSNTAQNAGGGAAVSGDATLTGGLFQGNQCSDPSGCSGGGGLWAGSALIATDTAFIGNHAQNDGGGAFAQGQAQLSQGRFQGNVAGSGGGLYAANSLALTGTLFIGNSAVNYGGGLEQSANQQPGRVVNALFARDSARVAGDALYLASSGSVAILHTTVASPTLGSSAAIVIAAGSVGITNSIIATATTGIQLAAGSAWESHNLFFGNSANLAGGVTAAGGSLTGAPDFADPNTDDYHIRASSAARDIGVDAGVYTDIDGEPRPQGNAFDAGYDEITAVTALDDRYATPEDTPLVVAAPGVLVNDSGLDQQPLTAALALAPLTGTFDLAADGAFTYTPTLAFNGLVTFSYRASDGALLSAPATVSVLVDQPPVVGAGTAQTVTVGSLVKLNGSSSADPDNDLPLSYGWRQTGGTAVVLSSSTISRPTFTAPGSPAVLTFRLAVTDALGLAGTPATTTVTVTDAAIGGLSAATKSPTALRSATPFTATIAHGTNVSYAWGFGDGATGSGTTVQHTYSALGLYTVLVTATNSLGQATATTTVTVADQAITGLGAAGGSPRALGSATPFTATIAQGTNVSYAWGFGDGSAAGSGATASHAYGAPGTYTAVVTATNSTNQMTETTVVTVDDVPIAAGDVYTTLEDTPVHIVAPGVLANDTDTFPRGLTAQVVAGPLTGTLALVPSGAFTYTPPLNFNGAVTFTYQAGDGIFSSAPALVTVTVQPMNHAPTIVGLHDVTTTVATAVGPISFTVGDVETPAGALTVTVQSSNPALVPLAGIQLGGSGAARTVAIMPAEGQTGRATITLTVSDGQATTSLSFVVTVVEAERKLYLPLLRR